MTGPEAILPILPGGIFSYSEWERSRSRLHHDDYHYRFLHYLLGGDLEADLLRSFFLFLSGRTERLPEQAAKAINNWPPISKALRDLFDRAGHDALTHPDALLAYTVLGELGGIHPESLACRVRERAEALLSKCITRDAGAASRAVENSMKLAVEIDEFVARCASPGGMTPNESSDQSAGFLNHCRKLDRALSDLPRHLRATNG